ncbi:hypothetical protein [Kitasatospora sp. NPDC057500]|uniref:hypothetical protein n=1 Tax=Kitasatospora sp. NPDC057500 TaxID=3346151 RepID=UPI003691AAE4
MTTRNTTHGPEPEHAAHAMDGAVPGGWSAVVYGRTLRVDQWWRALPAGVDRQGAVGDAVRAAVAGGSRLEYGPRFLLHRDVRGVLVGAACELGLISREMVQDRFGRPLYGFVGWYRPASADTGGRIPTLAELTEHLADWAGPVYTEWIAPTWEAEGREEAEPWTTRPVAAPWPERAPGAAGGPAVPAAWRPALPAGTHLLPEADAHGVWAAAAAGPGRCVLVTGWRRRSDADADRLTHLTSADCHGYQLLRPPPPRPSPPTPPVSEQGPASKSGAKSGAKSDATSDAKADAKADAKSDGKSGSSTWGRTARGLGKLGKAMVDAFWSEEPEQPEAGRSDPERSESTPKRTDGQTSDRRAPGVRPGGGPRFGRARVPGRDPYDGLGEPLPGPASPAERPAPYGDERSAPPTPPAPPAPNASPVPPDAGVPRPAAAPYTAPEAAPRWRSRSVDPQQADLSGMFGDFDDDPATPPPASAAPSAPPAQPPKGPSAPGDRTDPATGEPS